MVEYWLSIVIFLIGFWIFKANFTGIIVFEHEFAVLYKNGRQLKSLSPGKYYTTKNSQIYKVDKRIQFLHISGQEVLCKDKVHLKISLVLEYQVDNIDRYYIYSGDHTQNMYTLGQLILREVISEYGLDEALDNPKALSETLLTRLKPKLNAQGLHLIQVYLKDFMLSNELKRAYADTLKTKKEAEAALEKARGETASLRHLANASHQMNNNPALFQLRLLQALEKQSGHTIVFHQGTGSAMSITHD